LFKTKKESIFTFEQQQQQKKRESNYQKMLKLISLLICFHVVTSKLYPIEVKYPLMGDVSSPGTPWPKPQVIEGSSKKVLYLNPNNFRIYSNFIDCDIMQENMKHYTNILFPPKIPNKVEDKDPLLTDVLIEVTDTETCKEYPHSKMDESCKQFYFYFRFKIISFKWIN
jgi:hypothetical protein